MYICNGSIDRIYFWSIKIFWLYNQAKLNIDIGLDSIDGTRDELGGEVPYHKERCDIEALLNVSRVISNQWLEVSKEEDDENGTKEEFIVLLFVEKSNPDQVTG